MSVYRVEINKTGCENCGGGHTWDVIGPKELALSISYGNEQDAQDMAEELNEAYEKGKAVGWAEVPPSIKRTLYRDYMEELRRRPEQAIKVFSLLHQNGQNQLPTIHNRLAIVSVERSLELLRIVVA